MMRGRGQCPRPARWLTGPRLAGETGGALGLTPKSSVVTTAVIQAGARLPLMVAAWHAIAVSRPIAEAGTGTPGAGPGGRLSTWNRLRQPGALARPGRRELRPVPGACPPRARRPGRETPRLHVERGVPAALRGRP